jgi:predicted thioredoxin/glutaredoxin
MVAIINIFTKKNCPNCPKAKALGEELKKMGKNVEFFDVETPEGLAEALMHNVLSTPSVIISQGVKVVAEFLGDSPKIEDVIKWL